MVSMLSIKLNLLLAAMKLLNHMNVGYRGEARRISGALYQRVAT